MADFIDNIIGIFHFITDRTPGNVPMVEPRPRHTNPWSKDGKVVVSKVVAGGDIKASIEKSITQMGNISQAIARGDRVLIKPNFNSPDPLPAATDPVFLRAVVEILVEAGAKVMVGESSGGMWRPTGKVFKKLGLLEMSRSLGVELVSFDDRPRDWVRIKTGGEYLSTVCMPRSAYEADKIVYLPCMKTHILGDFSGALKLSVGFMHPGQRRALHIGNLRQKVAEINLCWQPDLIIMDGRKAFITGGPSSGQLADPEPNLILASGDLIAIDVEGMKVILGYKAKNKLPANPYELIQVATALQHKLGVGEGEYIVVG